MPTEIWRALIPFVESNKTLLIISHNTCIANDFSFIEECLKQAPYEQNALINALCKNSSLSKSDINLLILEIFFGGIDAVSFKSFLRPVQILIIIILN